MHRDEDRTERRHARQAGIEQRHDPGSGPKDRCTATIDADGRGIERPELGDESRYPLCSGWSGER